MAYLFFIDDMLLPIAPSKLDISIENKNDTMVLINDGEINILKKAGLTNISFDVLLPNVVYPFATYVEGFKGANCYLEKFKELKNNKQPFQFIVTRDFPRTIVVEGIAKIDKFTDGEIMQKLSDEKKGLVSSSALKSTNMRVSLEDYKIKEDAKQGFDVLVSVELKQYRDFGTKLPSIIEENGETTVSVEEKRETVNSPEPKSAKKYTVAKGDTLWGIAKRFYGNGSKYPVITDNNKIVNPNVIEAGQVLTIPTI